MQIDSNPGKKGTPFWERPFLVGQLQRKGNIIGATEESVSSNKTGDIPSGEMRGCRLHTRSLDELSAFQRHVGKEQ